MIRNLTVMNQEVVFEEYPLREVYFQNQMIGHSKILHVGCADWPIYDISYNLHAKLLKANSSLEGYDPSVETIENMKSEPTFKDAIFHTTLPEKTYDMILMPEVVEHLLNPGHELELLFDRLEIGGKFIITGPNAFCPELIAGQYNRGNVHAELVHSDHKSWYSLYTLPNLIRSVFGSRVQIQSIGLLNRQSMVFVNFKKLC